MTKTCLMASDEVRCKLDCTAIADGDIFDLNDFRVGELVPTCSLISKTALIRLKPIEIVNVKKSRFSCVTTQKTVKLLIGDLNR